MKRKIYSAFALAAAMMLVPSCSSDEEMNNLDQASNSSEISIGILASTLDGTRTACTESYASCYDDAETNDNLKVYITINKGASLYKKDTLDIIKNGSQGKWVTEPTHVEFTNSDHFTITELSVEDRTVTPHRVYFKGVETGADYAIYVDKPLPHDITADVVNNLYKKPIIDTWVLCAENQPADFFVKPKENLNKVKVNCIPLFVDICNKDKEDFVANGTAYSYRLVKDTKPVESDFNGVTPLTDTFGEGKVASWCYADNLEIGDEKEWYLFKLVINGSTDGIQPITVTKVLSLDQVQDYKNCPEWNAESGFLDFYFCPEECENPLNEDFDNTTKAKLTEEGWDGLDNLKIEVKNEGGNPDGYLLMLGTDKGTTDNYKIETSQFKYTTGQKITMDARAYIKESKYFHGYQCHSTIKPVLINTETGVRYEFDTHKVKINGEKDKSWCFTGLTFTHNCPPIPCGCYTLELNIEMPGEFDQWGHTSKWYDNYNFGLDNLKCK